MGFAGDDCSVALCPRGYEPISLLSKSNRRTVRLTIGNKGGFNAGKYTFSFSGANIYFNSNTTVDDTLQCNKKLSKLKSIKHAECIQEFTNSSSGIGSYLISILDYPTFPYLNNLYDHNGSPSLEEFQCDASTIDDEFAIEPYCLIEDVVSTNLPLYQECAGHGLCDTKTGICECSPGFNGVNCEDIKDDEDLFVYGTDAPLPNFKGNLLELNVRRDMSSDFNILSASTRGENITTIRGDGILEHNYNLAVDSEIAVGGSDFSPSLESIFGSIILATGLEDKENHILSSYNNNDVFSLDTKGNLDIKDDLMSNSFSITKGGVKLETTTLLGGKLIGGDASLGDVFMNHRSIDTVESSNILSLRKSDTLLSINQIHDSKFPLMTITNDNSSPSSFLNINNNDINILEINKEGVLKLQNIHMNSDKINVLSNSNLNILSGGMEIMDGGLIIENGNIEMNKQEISSGSINTESSHKQDSVIKTNPSNEKYAGNIIELKNNFDNSNIKDTTSHILTAKNGNDYLIDIHSDGNVITLGDMNIKGKDGLSVTSHTAFLGGISLHQSTVIASTIESINIPSSSSYVVIKDDGVSYDKNDDNIIQNKVAMSSRFDGATVGQIVIISNKDKQDTTGDVSVPSGSTLLFIFDGTNWVDMEALKAPIIQNFKKIKSLKVDNNIDIGDHEFSSGRLKSNSMRAKSIPVIDRNGEFQDPEKFYYSNGVLTFPSLKTARFLSDIDLNGHNVNNSMLSNASVINSLMSSNRVKVDKQFGLAYFLATGELIGAPSVTLNEQGKLVIKELSTDLDLNSFKMLNVDLDGLGISDSMVISTNNLNLLTPLLEKDNENITFNRKKMNEGILFADSNNIMKTVNEDIESVIYSKPDSSFNIGTLSASSIGGSINGNGNVISNMNMKTGKLRDISTLSVDKEVVFLFDKEINDNEYLLKTNLEMNEIDTLLIQEENNKKKIQDLKNNIEIFVKDKKLLEETLLDSDKLRNSYTVELSGFNDEISQYTDLNQPMEENILSIRELISSYEVLLVEKNERLRERIDARNTVQSLLSGTNGDSSMSNLIDSLEKDVIKEGNTISQIEAEITSISEDITKEYSNIAEIESRNKEIVEKIKESTDKINNYNNSQENQLVATDEIKSNINTLSNDIEISTKTLDELNSNQLELERNIDCIRSESSQNDNINDNSNDDNDSLLGINRKGMISPIVSSNANLLKINNLDVESLSLLDSIDGNNNLLKNIKFDGETVDYGHPSLLQVGNIKLSNSKYASSIDDETGDDDNSNYESLLTHEIDGILNPFNEIKIFKNKDKFGDEVLIKSINNPKIFVESDLIFSGGLDLKSKFLGTDSDGRVISGKNIHINNVNIEKIININSDANIILSNIKSSLLVTNSDGGVTSSSESQDINIELYNLRCNSTEIATININNAYIKDVAIPSFSSEGDLSSLLSVQSDGKMMKVNADQKITLPSSTTTSLDVSVDILAKSFFITDEVTIKLSNEFPLSVSPSSHISYTETLNVDSVEANSINSKDLTALNKINLADTKSLSSISSLLSINGDNNEVKLTSKLELDQVEVSNNMHSSDISVQGNLKYTGKECENGEVLTVLKDFNIICSKDVNLSSLNSETAKFKSIITEKLVVNKENDVNNEDGHESLITIDEQGLLSKIHLNDIRDMVTFALPADVNFDKMIVSNDLNINKNLKFSYKDPNLLDKEGFLSVDEEGNIVKLLNNELSFDSAHIVNDFHIDDTIETNNLIVNSLSVSSIPKAILDKNEKLKTENKAIISNSKGSLSGITNIHVKEGEDKTKVEQITFTASKIDVSSDIHISGLVYVAESANIEGSVIGSGPYMDSSDVRLKKDITSLPPSTSLDQIMKLKPYYYYLRSDEFPSKKFETKEQIGWIADDVQEIIPEIVQEDNDGFLSVAYARTNVLIASALTELRAESNQEINEIQNEINELKILLEELSTNIE
jgi:hypothetical protein